MLQRVTLKNHSTGEEKILFLNSEQEKDKTHFMDKESGVELELEDNTPLLEWLANNYKRFGAALEIITGQKHFFTHNKITRFLQRDLTPLCIIDRSQEGSQYVRGFGGIGGMLRYLVDFQTLQSYEDDEDEYDLDDY